MAGGGAHRSADEGAVLRKERLEPCMSMTISPGSKEGVGA